MSSPARRFKRFCQSSGMYSGCSITARYMSAIHNPPSGPVRSDVGRNQLSLDAKNSDCCSSAGRRLVKRHALARQDFSMDQVMDRLADEANCRRSLRPAGRRER